MEVLLSKKIFNFLNKKIKLYFRLLSLIETYSQNLIFDELDKTFNRNNLAVSIVNRPARRTEPIIGFSFGR